MTWSVEFTSSALKAFARIDRTWQQRITSHLREVSNSPDPRFRGKALTGDQSGLWRYRVGDYRIVCQILDDVLIIQVITVGHRRNVYR